MYISIHSTHIIRNERLQQSQWLIALLNMIK